MGATEGLLGFGSRLRTRLFTLLIANQFGEFGTGSRVVPPFRFHGLRQMRLGKGVMIERDCWIHTLGGSGDAGSVKLVIGSHAAIGMGATISAAQQVTIGEYALLARNVYISDHAHDFADPSLPIMRQGITDVRSVSIGRHTWLGQNVVVLPGVSIGEHCVIGANSVVKSSVPDFSVAVGTPARVVKRYNHETKNWEKVRKDL